MSEQNLDGLDFDLPINRSSVIKVIGVGGGGSNAVNHMKRLGINGVDFIVCNTDAQALTHSPVENKVQLGANLTEGLGAGANPEVGERAALESVEEVKKLLGDSTKMLFITAGMGGGTGTGAAPVIAKAAMDLGILTVGIVTIPFAFEGKVRMRQAEDGIAKLRGNVDSLIVINNNKLREVYGNLGFKAGFAKADEVLATAAKGIAEVITHHYTTNIDLKDAKTVLHQSGTALMGSGIAEGDNRAMDAIRNALDSPLLNDNQIIGAKNVLLLIISGNEEDEITFDEIGEINDYIQQEAGGDANIIMGIGSDTNLGRAIQITVIATGFVGTTEVNQTVQKEEQRIVHNLDLNAQAPSPVEAPIAKVQPTTQKPSLIQTNLFGEETPAVNPSTPLNHIETPMPIPVPVEDVIEEEVTKFDLAAFDLEEETSQQEPVAEVNEAPEVEMETELDEELGLVEYEAPQMIELEEEIEENDLLETEMETELEAIEEAPTPAFNMEPAYIQEVEEPVQEFEPVFEDQFETEIDNTTEEEVTFEASEMTIEEEFTPSFEEEVSEEEDFNFELSAMDDFVIEDEITEVEAPAAEIEENTPVMEYDPFDVSIDEAFQLDNSEPAATLEWDTDLPAANLEEEMDLEEPEVVEAVAPVQEEEQPRVIRHSLEELLALEERLNGKKTTAPQTPVKETPVMEEDEDLKFEVKQAPAQSSAATTEINPMDTSLREAVQKQAVERRTRLKAFNYTFKNNQNQILENEKVPAYKRMGMDIDQEPYSTRNTISRTSLGNDGLELRNNNSFLHDNVD